MAKRRVDSSEEEEELADDNSDYTHSVTDDKPKPKPSRTRAQQKSKRVKDESLSASEDLPLSTAKTENPPPAKKPKIEEFEEKPVSKKIDGPKENSNDAAIVKSTSEGDKFIELGKKKRATVRSFKNIPLLDIREFYGADGDEKPGKKGISLTSEQWEILKNNASTIDEFFSVIKKKK